MTNSTANIVHSITSMTPYELLLGVLAAGTNVDGRMGTNGAPLRTVIPHTSCLYTKTINFFFVYLLPRKGLDSWQYITTCSKTSYIFDSLLTTFRHMTIQWKRTKTSKACHYANSSTRTKSTWKLSLICGQISHSSHMPCGSLMNRTFVFHCSYR